MQYRGGDAAAIRFGRAFYDSVAAGLSIDEAVLQGRLIFAKSVIRRIRQITCSMADLLTAVDRHRPGLAPLFARRLHGVPSDRSRDSMMAKRLDASLRRCRLDHRGRRSSRRPRTVRRAVQGTASELPRPSSPVI
jgi:hypothetical protein